MYYPAFHILGIEIPTWFIFGWLNILLGKSLLLYLGYRRGWPFSSWLLIVLFSTVGGGLGAIFSSSIMGVVLGAVGFMFFGKWALGFRHQIGDIIAIYLAVLIGIGRFGCLLNGCCFGSPTDLPWGITYSVGTPAHWLHLFSGQIDTSTLTSLAIHPIQFYESIFLF